MAFDEKFEVGSQQMQIPKLPSIFTLFYLFCIHLGKSEKATKALGKATSHHIHHLSLSLLFFSPLLSVYHNSSILSFRSIKKLHIIYPLFCALIWNGSSVESTSLAARSAVDPSVKYI
jgi:hypothetical protein